MDHNNVNDNIDVTPVGDWPNKVNLQLRTPLYFLYRTRKWNGLPLGDSKRSASSER